MRIVHVYKDYYPPTHGGIEQTIARLAVHQTRAGHSVTALVSGAGERRTREEILDGVRVIRCGEWARVLSTPICPDMPARLASLEADLFHLHYPNPPGELSWMLARPRGVLVMSYYADVVRQAAIMPLYGPLVRRLLRRCDLVLATSDRHLEFSSYFRDVRDRCAVVPLGIDLEPFSAPESHAAKAAEVRARFGSPIVLFVGRLRYYKGLNVLLDAMRDVDARAVIVGTGPMEASLREQHALLGLGDRVRFAGHVPDEEMPAWIAAADVGVLPSTHTAEVYGLAMCEMMASGVPVVCTELGTGTSFVNADGESGLVVPPNDPSALAGALNRIVKDPALRARLGAGARERSHRMFSAEGMMRELDRAYALAFENHRRRTTAR